MILPDLILYLMTREVKSAFGVGIRPRRPDLTAGSAGHLHDIEAHPRGCASIDSGGPRAAGPGELASGSPAWPARVPRVPTRALRRQVEREAFQSSTGAAGWNAPRPMGSEPRTVGTHGRSMARDERRCGGDAQAQPRRRGPSSVVAAEHEPEQDEEAHHQRDRRTRSSRRRRARERGERRLEQDRHRDRRADQLAHDDDPDRSPGGPSRSTCSIDSLSCDVSSSTVDPALVDHVEPLERRRLQRRRAAGQLLADRRTPRRCSWRVSFVRLQLTRGTPPAPRVIAADARSTSGDRMRAVSSAWTIALIASVRLLSSRSPLSNTAPMNAGQRAAHRLHPAVDEVLPGEPVDVGAELRLVEPGVGLPSAMSPSAMPADVDLLDGVDQAQQVDPLGRVQLADEPDVEEHEPLGRRVGHQVARVRVAVEEPVDEDLLDDRPDERVAERRRCRSRPRAARPRARS